MKTSLIIPSYNPVLKLPETLERLVLQAHFINELIIIIDNNNYTDFAKSLVEKYAGRININVFPQKNAGRGKSRNRGVELAEGDLIIFLDDDMLVEPDLIEKHIQYHTERPGIIVSGNGYRNPENANYDFGKYLIQMEEGWKAKSPGNGEITLERFNFTSCNMSLPQNIFENLNGFDTRFPDGEDFDFAIRAINKGIPVVYDNTLVAWHNDWPDIKSFIRRQSEYAKAKREIAKVHPEYLSNFPRLLPKAGKGYKKYMAYLLYHPLIDFVASDNSIFAMLPVKLKFMLYDIAFMFGSFNNRTNRL